MFTPPTRLEMPCFTLRAWSVDDAPCLQQTLNASDAHLRAWTPRVVAHTGRGLATKAASVLTRTAFSDPDIHRVEIRCDPRNITSAKVPHRLGCRVKDTLVEGTDTAQEAGSTTALTTALTVWQLTRAEFVAKAEFISCC